MIGHRRNTNLRDILVKARIRFPSTKRLNKVSGKITNVCVYISNIVCIYCPKVDTSDKIMSTNSGRKYKTQDGGSWGSNNVVYLVTWKVCHKQYVGETFRTLKQRFYEHFYDWINLKYPAKAPPSLLHKNSSAVAKHFCLNEHSLDDVKIQILQYILKPPLLKNTIKYRKMRELHWIWRIFMRYLPVSKISLIQCLNFIYFTTPKCCSGHTSQDLMFFPIFGFPPLMQTTQSLFFLKNNIPISLKKLGVQPCT